jgi:hypothetical protein
MAEPAKTIKRRKPAVQRKQEWIRLRVSADQKLRFEQAAERDGLGLSAWLRRLALRASEK